MGKHKTSSTRRYSGFSNWTTSQKLLLIIPTAVLLVVAGLVFMLFSSDKGEGLHDPKVPFPAGMGQYKTDLPMFLLDEQTLPDTLSVGELANVVSGFGGTVTQTGSTVKVFVPESKKEDFEKSLTDKKVSYTEQTTPMQKVVWSTEVPSSSTYPSAEQLSRIQDVLWANWSVQYDPSGSKLVLSWVGQGLTTSGLDAVAAILEEVSKKEVVTS